MSIAVLDASVFVAAISPNDIHHLAARDLYDSYSEALPFLVPSLFRIEVVAALARRGEPEAFIDTTAVLITGPRFHTVAMDGPLIETATHVARAARLRAYDAVNAALALNHEAALLTLDPEVRSRVSAAFPHLRLFDSAHA